MNNLNPLVSLIGAVTLTALMASAAPPPTNPVAMTLPAAPAAAGTNLFPDKVVARGKGFEVKRSQIEEVYTGYRAAAAAQGQVLPEARRSEIESNILDQIIVTRVLFGRATDADRATAKTNSQETFDQYRQRAPSEEAFARQLQANGMTPETFRTRILEQITCREVIDRELRTQFNITDELCKKFYDDNPPKFDQPDQVRVSHILIATKNAVTGADLTEAEKKEKRQLADKILARAKKGEDFAALVKEFSDDPGSKEHGGEYTFAKGGQMVAEFETASFGLGKVNQISDIVPTQYGFHIIKLLEKIPARKIPFSEVSVRIKEQLALEEIRNRLPAYLERIKKEAQVEILEAAATPVKP